MLRRVHICILTRVCRITVCSKLFAVLTDWMVTQSEFGYIVDYKQLFGDLKNAMDTYTSGAFENYDPEDVDGLIKDRSAEAIKHFNEVYDQLEELCEGVEAPKGDLQYMHYFCGESGMSEETDEIYSRLRERLYKLVSGLVRAFAEAKPYMVDIYTAKEVSAYDEK